MKSMFFIFASLFIYATSVKDQRVVYVHSTSDQSIAPKDFCLGSERSIFYSFSAMFLSSGKATQFLSKQINTYMFILKVEKKKKVIHFNLYQKEKKSRKNFHCILIICHLI